MHYTYILYSKKSNNFYYGLTSNVHNRLVQHNLGEVFSTAPYRPWELVFYAAFASERLASEFEHYLKTGSGKAFAYKRLLKTDMYKKDKQ
ncbi:MAG: hypothetical protein ACD_41C00299G0014 [uncultured bacterium]|nr:MAG: hypothetical protein ACD_41C00299G0014 [uncultured bacterium]